MGLLQVRWKNGYYLAQRSLLLCLSILLAACASAANQQPEQVPEITTEQVEQQAVIEPEAEQLEPIPLTPELMYYILTAEIAGQQGEIGVAVDLYEKAANMVDSPAVAERSAEITNYTRDQQRIDRALKRWVEVAPNDPDIYILQTPFLMLQGDFDGVITAVNTALSLAPEKTAGYLAQVSENLNILAPHEPALNVLSQLQVYKDNNPEALLAYARMAVSYKQYDAALPAVETVLQQQAGREDALILKAEILQRLGNGAEAITLLSKPAKKKDASADLRFAYAKLLGENNQMAQSRMILEQLNDELPNNNEILFALGLLALDEKDSEQAKKYFNQLVKQGDPSNQAAFFMGLSEELSENTDAALIWYASIPAESPRFQAAQSRYINLLADNGQLDDARLHLKLLREEQPGEAVSYYTFEAAFLREREQYQAVFDLYNEALDAHPGNLTLLYGRAMAAEPLNRLSVLEEDLRAILAVQPDNAAALNALGYTLTDRTDQHQEALMLISKAVALQPNDPFYLDSLGWVNYRLGNLPEAEIYLKQAVVLKPDPEFLAHLGEVLWQQGKHSEAKRVWKQGLQKSADNKLLLETMNRFGQ